MNIEQLKEELVRSMPDYGIDSIELRSGSPIGRLLVVRFELSTLACIARFWQTILQYGYKADSALYPNSGTESGAAFEVWIFEAKFE